jgi:hypothetical protein
MFFSAFELFLLYFAFLQLSKLFNAQTCFLGLESFNTDKICYRY